MVRLPSTAGEKSCRRGTARPIDPIVERLRHETQRASRFLLFALLASTACGPGSRSEPASEKVEAIRSESASAPPNAMAPETGLAAHEPAAPTGDARPIHLRPGVVAPVISQRKAIDLSGVRPAGSAWLPVVEAVITAEGAVEDVRIVRSAGPEMDSVIVETMKEWRFRPATLDGKPVAVYYTMTVNIHWQ